MKTGVSYGTTLYYTEGLKNIIPRYVRQVRKILNKDETVTGLISAGSSGAALATAILLRSKKDLQHVHIQRQGSCSHSGIKSGILYPESNLIFIDDFIDSGTTFNHCKDTLVKKLDSRGKIGYIVITETSEEFYTGMKYEGAKVYVA